jgi:uncharacterized membrane protein
MTLDPTVLAAIAAMAAVTYMWRAGGYWVFRQIRPSPLLRHILAYIPGTLFVSFITPGLITGGPQQWAGAVATVAVMLATRNMPAAIFAGTAAAWSVWAAR